MQKRLAKQALIIFAILNILPYNPAQEIPKASETAQSHKPAKIVAPVAPKDANTPSIGQGVAKEQRSKSQTQVVAKDQPKNIRIVGLPPKDVYDLWTFGATLALAGVGLIGIVVGICTLFYLRNQSTEARHQRVIMRRTLSTIRRQTRAIEEQAKDASVTAKASFVSAMAADKSAKAALRQIRHAIRSDRPWMAVKYDEDGLRSAALRFIATNRGNSPAKVTMYMVEKIRVNPKNLNEGLKYGGDGRFDEPQWRLTGDDFKIGETFDYGNLLDSEVRLANGDLVLFQGFVRYEDTISDDVHETRFCYEAFSDPAMGMRLRMFTARGYNVMT
jgi:CHASE3 domain sensor protein